MTSPRPEPFLTERFHEALVYAAHVHRTQQRKSSGTPYIAHLLAVASLVLEYGGGEDEAIAALLHDAVEDQGGMERAAEISARFGESIAEIVIACSDSSTMPKPPWSPRKEAFIAALAAAAPAVQLIVAADKLHNARSLVADHQRHGSAIWKRFGGGRDGTLWYLRSVTDVLLHGEPRELAMELDRVVKELEGME